MTGAASLTGIIKSFIELEGPVTFARFMEMALYYPELGYYASVREKIGRKGDYYTSSDVHALFAGMIARQAAQMWAILGHPPVWQFIEYGAGKGKLAYDFLNQLQQQYPDCYAALTYWIIDVSPDFREKQQAILSGLNLPPGKVSWADSPAQILELQGNRITGCIFSNELIDAFPVHRVRMREDGLKEIYVDYRDNRFVEVEGLLSEKLLQDYFAKQRVALKTGQTAEVNLAAIKWLKNQAECLEKGYIITIDYGLTSDNLYNRARFDGTLRCFRRHTLNDDPYQYIGEQDITANVNFSALEIWGKEAGLNMAGLVTQSDFLLNAGILDILKTSDDYSFNEKKLHTTLAIKQLIMPEGMGRYFKVLIQHKGLPAEPELIGLRKLSIR
ncbi:protein of unknown function DUF185 [Desulfofarcimen acetoxidans DSM 771]|jgi:SAM-dependent MidA family methyltransferase|uniref:SAM-dependent methyltransferase n=1 Tax=Desulfofarcimen acetoxidans (strain ATCC 49208 / DSM 771 / KCTC 5769 / VKM B-1644 / 5575) TaxID=485916 RepID=C8VWF4_DESAS|nr:SAM-dependent methyltransferase [Desulfofarcimen acetoxidans]ACV62506.1 protein of unknown function DUF185 [Desulfofarcimen acetoxidans DSM 771]